MASKAVNAIIRPPRLKYDFKKMLPKNVIPGFGDVQRMSFAFFNSRQQQLYGSFYAAPTPSPGNPCVVYMHGNSSNQLEGRFAVSLFIPVGVNVFCFDFAGCGCSEGKYISLGHFESEDAETVVDILHRDFHCEKIAFWGRSMGAVTSLIVSSKRSDICACVVDSPFRSLPILCEEIGRQKKVPQNMIDGLMPTVREKIMKKINVDINTIAITDLVRNSKTPTVFVHGLEDDFIPKENTEILFDACGCKHKLKLLVHGGHNDDRPESVLTTASTFLCHYLGIEIEFVKNEDCENDAIKTEQGSKQHFSNVDELMAAK